MSIILILALVGISWALYHHSSSIVVPITSFSECESAGFPVIDGLTRKCAVNGRVFVESVLLDGGQEFTGEFAVFKPRANQVVINPIKIEGRASHEWFGTDKIPVDIYDSDDSLLGSGNILMMDNEPGNDYNQFTGEIDIRETKTAQGYILIKQNLKLAGESVHEFKIPIAFSSETWNLDQTTEMKVFFNNQLLSSTEPYDCGSVFPVIRVVPNSDRMFIDTLSELIVGPQESERQAGYTTSFNSNVHVQDIQIDERIAYIDFNDQFNSDVTTDCRVKALTAQVTQTMIQFPTIDKVIVTVNGESPDIY